ncbi:MAG: polyprenyl synthetase family protein [Acidobacteriota bacterium]
MGENSVADAVSAARSLLGDDMERFEAFLSAALEEQEGYLSATEHDLYARGKKLRPLMLMLSARLAGHGVIETISDKTIKAAVSLEMLHVATLIHDDIVDEAPLRRGLTSVHDARGTEMAVLIGDLQFIQAIRFFAHAVETQDDMRLVRLVLDVGFRICCGELDELATDPDVSADELRERYLQTVDRKTAVLFGLACEAGASLAGAGKRSTLHISQFGRSFGLAFQIMDDLMDFVRPDAHSGKLVARDLRQGRLSLPIVYALDELPREHVLHRLVRRQTRAVTTEEKEQYEEDVRRAVAAVVVSRGFLRAYSEARDAINLALRSLERFPDVPERRALADLAREVVDRSIHRPDAELARRSALVSL